MGDCRFLINFSAFLSNVLQNQLCNGSDHNHLPILFIHLNVNETPANVLYLKCIVAYFCKQDGRQCNKSIMRFSLHVDVVKGFDQMLKTLFRFDDPRIFLFPLINWINLVLIFVPTSARF